MLTEATLGTWEARALASRSLGPASRFPRSLAGNGMGCAKAEIRCTPSVVGRSPHPWAHLDGLRQLPRNGGRESSAKLSHLSPRE